MSPLFDRRGGPGARSSPKNNENQTRARGQPDIKGSALGWFDHQYSDYAELLRRYVGPSGVDYRALKEHRMVLDRIVAELARVSRGVEPSWSRDQRLAFWINAYNIFTLRAILDNYPIEGSWFSRGPRNSIRQIDGVWTTLKWEAAGRTVTLDDIEHRILRPEFREPLIHFAVNCASISCPPLGVHPYRAADLDRQLDEATRAYLGSSEGVVVDGDDLSVSSLFKWYGDDFAEQYAPLMGGRRSAKDRAILGTIVRYGPERAARIARRGEARIGFLAYNWALNDTSTDMSRR